MLKIAFRGCGTDLCINWPIHAIVICFNVSQDFHKMFYKINWVIKHIWYTCFFEKKQFYLKVTSKLAKIAWKPFLVGVEWFMHKPARLHNGNMFSHVWNLFHDVSWGLQSNKPPVSDVVFPQISSFSKNQWILPKKRFQK